MVIIAPALCLIFSTTYNNLMSGFVLQCNDNYRVFVNDAIDDVMTPYCDTVIRYYKLLKNGKQVSNLKLIDKLEKSDDVLIRSVNLKLH